MKDIREKKISKVLRKERNRFKRNLGELTPRRKRELLAYVDRLLLEEQKK